MLGLDPGHGDGDNKYNNYSEGTAMRQLALNIREKIKPQTVFLTRTGPDNPVLLARAKAAGKAGVKTLISLHTNYPNDGVLVFYSVKRPQDKDMAELIGKEISKAMGIKFREARVKHSSRSTSSNPLDYYGIIRNSIQYGVDSVFLVEHGSHMEFAKDVQGNIKKVTEVYLKLFGRSDNVSANATVKVGSAGLNVRAGAGTSYKVIGGLKNGERIEVLSTSGDWHKIKWGSGTGYVHSDYVVLDKSTSSNDVEKLKKELAQIKNELAQKNDELTYTKKKLTEAENLHKEYKEYFKLQKKLGGMS